MQSDRDTIRKHLVEFYSNLYCEEESWSPFPTGLDFHSMEPMVAAGLERPFTIDEI